MGHIEQAINLQNVSGHSCRMWGYPGLGLLDRHGHALPGYADFDTSVAPHRVVLRPHRWAHATIRWSDVPVGSQTSCPVSRWLLVTPPDTFSSRRVRAAIDSCGDGRIEVRPIQPGAVAPVS